MERKSSDKSPIGSTSRDFGEPAKTYAGSAMGGMENMEESSAAIRASSPDEEIKGLRDQLKTAQEALAAATKSAGDTAKKFVNDTASTISDSVSAAASGVSDQSAKVASAVSDGTTDVAKKVEQFTRSNPMLALGAVLVIGLLLGSRSSGMRS